MNFGDGQFEVSAEFTIRDGVAPGNRVLVMKGETVLGNGWFIGYGEWQDDEDGLAYGLIAQMSDEVDGGINLDLRAAAPQIYDGNWHSAKLSREQDDAVLYLDCAEIARVPLQDLGSISNESPVHIGRHNQPKGYHIGQVRSVTAQADSFGATTLLSDPVAFNGSHYIQVPDRPELNFGTDSFEVYVEFAVKDGLAPGNRVLVMKGETVVGNGWFIGYGEWQNDEDGLAFGLIAQMSNEGDGGINLDLRAAAPQIYDGGWHSARLVRDGSDAALYLDCVEVARVPLQNLGSVSNESPLLIGRHVQPKDYHIGSIRSVVTRSPL